MQAETCGHYLTLTEANNKGVDGINYLMSPPLRSEEDRKAMWEGIKDGTLSLVTSDNEVFSRKIKEKDLEIDGDTGEKIPCFTTPVNGIPGLEERFGLLMIGVNNGDISLNKLVEVGSTNPPRSLAATPRRAAWLWAATPISSWWTRKRTFRWCGKTFTIPMNWTTTSTRASFPAAGRCARSAGERF